MYKKGKSKEIAKIDLKEEQGRTNKGLEDKLSKVLTTDKQKSFLRNRMAGLNKRQAAIQAGYAPSTASIMAKRLTDRLSCNRIFIEEAHRQGLTVEAIIGELKRGVTRAMHPQHPRQPDNFNRRAYTDLAMRLYGAYAPTKLDIDIEKKEMIIQITPELIERIKKAEMLMTNDAPISALCHPDNDNRDKEEKSPF